MAATPTRTSVPPHLRNKRPAVVPEPKPETKMIETRTEETTERSIELKASKRLGDFGDVARISATPPASIKSQLDKSTQNQVSL